MGGKHISIGKALPTYNSQIKSTGKEQYRRSGKTSD